MNDAPQAISLAWLVVGIHEQAAANRFQSGELFRGSAMYLSMNEAMALLERWKSASTPLQISLNRSGEVVKIQGNVSELKPASVTLVCPEREIELDLSQAEFNGDPQEHGKSAYGAYLVCEYRNGDTCYLYAPRSKSGA